MPVLLKNDNGYFRKIIGSRFDPAHSKILAVNFFTVWKFTLLYIFWIFMDVFRFLDVFLSWFFWLKPSAGAITWPG